MAQLPKTLPENDQVLEDLNRDLFGIIYALNEKYPKEAEFALMKLRAASEDMHRIRIKQSFGFAQEDKK